MRDARPRLRTVGAVIAAVLVLLVALSPTLLFGQSLSAFGLVVMGASLLGVGLLVRWGDGAGARTLGTSLVIIGAVILTLAVGLMALFLAGWGRGSDLPGRTADELRVREPKYQRDELIVVLRP